MNNKQKLEKLCKAKGIVLADFEAEQLASPKIPLIPKRKKEGDVLSRIETGVYYGWLLAQLADKMNTYHTYRITVYFEVEAATSKAAEAVVEAQLDNIDYSEIQESAIEDCEEI